jgi:hypothetical protein
MNDSFVEYRSPETKSSHYRQWDLIFGIIVTFLLLSGVMLICLSGVIEQLFLSSIIGI